MPVLKTEIDGLVQPIDLPNRKIIRKTGYDYSQIGSYFVTVCTAGSLPLFGRIGSPTREAADAQLLPAPGDPGKEILDWVEKAEEKFPQMKIDEKMLMPNHLHMIVSIREAGGQPLGGVIRWIKTMSSNTYFRGVKAGRYRPCKDAVWQRGYYEHIIRNAEEYKKIKQYILLNPARWYAKGMTYGEFKWDGEQFVRR